MEAYEYFLYILDKAVKKGWITEDEGKRIVGE